MVLKTNTSETKNKAWLLFIKNPVMFSDDIPVALSWPIVMQCMIFFPSPEVSSFYNLTNLGFFFLYNHGGRHYSNRKHEVHLKLLTMKQINYSTPLQSPVSMTDAHAEVLSTTWIPQWMNWVKGQVLWIPVKMCLCYPFSYSWKFLNL